jgi:hypothetical protein
MRIVYLGTADCPRVSDPDLPISALIVVVFGALVLISERVREA